MTMDSMVFSGGDSMATVSGALKSSGHAIEVLGLHHIDFSNLRND